MIELNAPPSRSPFMQKGGNNRIWVDWLNSIYFRLRGPLWRSIRFNLATAIGGTVPPTLNAFGPGGVAKEYEFNRGDSLLIKLEIDHNIAPGENVYPHVHWSTDGGGTGNVEWVLDYEIAKEGDVFATGTTITLVGAGTAVAWTHNTTEASDAQAFPVAEAGTILTGTLSRGNTVDTYPDTVFGHVFGLSLDLHYLTDRFGTPNREPDLYARG